MEDLCSKNRQDGKKVFQFSTKMGLFVILLDVTKTKSPLATSAILWSAKVNNTGFFFSFFDCNVRFSLFLFLVLLLLFVAAYLRCVWKNGQYQLHFMGGGRQKTLVNIYERVNTASHFASIGFGTLLRDKCHEEIDWFIIQRYQKQNCWAEALD